MYLIFGKTYKILSDMTLFIIYYFIQAQEAIDNTVYMYTRFINSGRVFI